MYLHFYVYAYLRKDGITKRIPTDEYNQYKLLMTKNKIPMSEWNFVTVRSKESKNRL